MFQIGEKTYDCPYCHNVEKVEGWCQRGVLVGVSAPFIIELEGAEITADGAQEIKPGDIYIAKRNREWKLLTCKYVDFRHWIAPMEDAYYFDTWECAKVVSIS